MKKHKGKQQTKCEKKPKQCSQAIPCRCFAFLTDLSSCLLFFIGSWPQCPALFSTQLLQSSSVTLYPLLFSFALTVQFFLPFSFLHRPPSKFFFLFFYPSFHLPSLSSTTTSFFKSPSSCVDLNLAIRLANLKDYSIAFLLFFYVFVSLFCFAAISAAAAAPVGVKTGHGDLALVVVVVGHWLPVCTDTFTSTQTPHKHYTTQKQTHRLDPPAVFALMAAAAFWWSWY